MEETSLVHVHGKGVKPQQFERYRDMSIAMTDPISMDKMGIDALKFSIDAFPMALDVYWIPIFTPSPLPASVMSMLAFYGIELKKPELKYKNSEVGVKASAYTSLGDFALYGFSDGRIHPR